MIYLEIIGVILYFLSVYFALKINTLTWITGILSEIIFIILFLNSQTYANAILQLILIFVCIDGWLKWKKDDNKNVSKIKPKFLILLTITSLLFIFGLGSIINSLPIIPDPYPYLDMSIFILSVVGIILLGFKKIENWYFWILVNIISFILYLLVGYYFIAIQSILLIIIDIVALKEWRLN